MTTTDLGPLVAAERRAYREYVRLSRGEALVTGQRVSPAAVEEARGAWVERLKALRAVATPEDIRVYWEGVADAAQE